MCTNVGTGGGPGAEENFAAWEQRDETNVVTYGIQQDSLIYLSVVHIWDKMYSFPLVRPKGPLPSDCQIEDGAIKTPANKKSADDKVLDKLTTVVNKLSADRQLVSRDLQSWMQGSDGTVDGVSAKPSIQDIVDSVRKTTEQIGVHEHKVDELERRKRAIKDAPGSKKEKLQKLQPLQPRINTHATLITTLTNVLDMQQKELSALEGGAEKDTADDAGSVGSVYST